MHYKTIPCINNRSKSNFHNINIDKACILAELANLKYAKIEKYQVLGIEIYNKNYVNWK